MNRELVKTLVQEMRSGRFKEDKTLPPENVLASEFGISRVTLREALLVLEYEGWISRKHGVGTIINHDVLADVRRLDTTLGIMKIIEYNGKKATSEIEDCSCVPASERIAEELKLPVGTPLLRFSTRFYADEAPAVYCTDYYPMMYVKETDQPDLSELKDFFAYIDGNDKWQDMDTFISRQQICVVPENVAVSMHVPKTTVCMKLCETGYDIYTEPMTYSEQYYLDSDFEYVLVRKYFKQ